MSDGEIGLADYMLALQQIGATEPALKARIAATLGLSIRPEEATGRQSVVPPFVPPKRPWPPRKEEEVPERVLPRLEPQPESQPKARELGGDHVAWLTDAPSWPPTLPEAPPSDDAFAVTQETEQLLKPIWLRGILKAALAQRLPEGDVDASALVERLARMMPIAPLPREPFKRVRGSVLVLLDLGSSMAPYRKDQWWLTRRLSSMLDSGSVNVAGFVGTPLRPHPPLGSVEAFRPPRPGTSVLVLTDLGIGRAPVLTERARPGEWRRFGGLIRSLNCPLIAFVPYPPHRWPPSLAKEIPTVQWDVGTTASDVAAVRRNAEGLWP